jgi:tetratricopeptide (TPR) repeat protein
MVEAATRALSPEALRDALGESAPEVAKLMPELRRLFPDIPAPPELPPEQERRYLFNGMREFVERVGRAQPLLLTLEDLHWADDSTMLLLQHIAQQLHEMPVLIVGTYRDVELDVARPLARALEELLRQRLAHRIALKRLPEAGVSAMLRGLSGQEPPKPLVDAVFSETEGNPFFVEEVFRHLAEEGKLFDTQGRWRSDLQVSELDVPEGVRLVIGRRLERVGEECRRVLTTAAVIGRDFSFELLEALREVDVDALLDAVDEAERAHLIASTSDGAEARFIFAHELIRQTLLSGLSHPRRQRLHLRVGQVMERHYVRNLEPHLGTLAAHFRLAGAAADVEKAIDYSLRAGEAARALFAYEEAAAHWQAALELMEESGADAERRAGFLERLADLIHVTSLDYRVGVDYLERALRVYEELGQAERAAEVHSRLGRHLSSYYDAMDIDRALAHYRAAEAVLGRGPKRAPLGDLYVGMASAAWWAVHTQEGLTASRRAMEIGERLGNEAIWAHAAALHGWHLFAGGRLAEGLALAERAWETADRLDDPAVAVAAAYIRGFLTYHLGDPRDLQFWCQRELAKPRVAQAPVQRRRLLSLLAWAHIFAGELAEASRLLADLAPDIPPEEGWVEGGVASADGDWERAAALLAKDVQLRHRNGDRYAGSDSAYLLARVQRVRGEHQQAEALLQEALVEGQLLLDFQARLELALLYAEMGRPHEARPHLERCRETLAQGEDWRGLVGRVALAEAAVAAVEGRLQEAEQQFEKAIEGFHRYTLPWEEAEALHLWGRALLATGQRERGLEKLDAAIEIYRRHGAGHLWIGRVEADKLRI